MENDIVIISAVRTAIGKFGGSLKSVSASQLGAYVLEEVVKRAKIEKSQVDEIFMGDCIQHSSEANTARTASLLAGFPHEVTACTIQRQCASGMQAVEFAALKLKAGDADFIIAGGVESMSNAPYLLPTARWGQRLQNGEMIDSVWELLYSGSKILEKEPYIMGETAEKIAEKYGITREEQDEIALRSHASAEKAIADGKFKAEIVPITIKSRKGDKVVDTDEHVRHGLAMSDLDKQRPAFAKGGSVTAGNASGLNDGAAAMLLTTRAKAEELGLNVLAVIKGFSVAGVDPKFMGEGPIPATRKILKKTNTKLEDIGLIELNEAFAAQYLACEKELGLNRDIVNVNGSGIGLGHPVGATGARIIVSLVYEMQRRNEQLGLATLCVGGGMGMACLVERP